MPSNDTTTTASNELVARARRGTVMAPPRPPAGRRRLPRRRPPASDAVRDPRRRRRWIWRLLGAALLLPVLVWLVIVLIQLRHPISRADLDAMIVASQSTAVYDRNGGMLQVYVSERDTLCFPIPLAEMNPWVIQATIAVEDERFRLHPGVDPLSILRATVSNIIHGRIKSGASTLTMQLAKQVRLERRTWRVKLVESAQALSLERQLSKDEILEYYLNIVPYGGNLLGTEAAAWRYFGKTCRELTLAESALLAGIPQAPARYQPDRFPVLAKARRDQVLYRMYREGYIDIAAYRSARAEPIAAEWRPLPFVAPHASQYARDLAPRQPRIDTTLDPDAQRLAEDILGDGVRPLMARGVDSGAVVVIDTASGELRAMVGSPGFFADPYAGQVNGALALRSPGSTLKPFLYEIAMDSGRLTPQRAVADLPLDIAGYQPQNYDRSFHGPVPAGVALSRSYNSPAVQLLADIGTPRFLTHLRNLGIASLDRDADHYGLSLALGGGDATLLEVTNAYAALARLGVYRPVRLLQRPGNASQDPDADTDIHRVCSPGAAWMVADMLSDMERLDGQILWKSPEQLPRMAWKTGTSFGHRDAWTVAYTPVWTVGVWLGRADGRPSDALVGQLAAAPIAARLIDTLSAPGDRTWYTPPAELQRRSVCVLSGMVAAPDCPSPVEDWALTSVSDPEPCTVHRRVLVDAARRVALCPSCSGSADLAAAKPQVLEQWPATVQTWLRQHPAGHRLAPPHLAGCPANGSPDAAPRIVSPGDGSQYVRLKNPPGGMPQRLSLEAEANGGELYWFVNGTLISQAKAGTPVLWDLQPGQHNIACVDAAGLGSRVAIEVKSF